MSRGATPRTAIAFLFAALLAAIATSAAAAAESVDALRKGANAGTVGIVSGGVEGTYIRIAADLAAVLDDGTKLRILPVIGKGSVQNIADIMFVKGIDIGIVQSDVLAYVKNERLYPGVDKSIQYITKLYDEEVHILAAPEIARLEDLAGRKVNIDLRGSGTAMTASLLFDRLGVAIEPTGDDQALALEKLKRGDIAALVYVAGKPARLFRDLTSAEGLHFLSVPLGAALLQTYLPARLAHEDYPQLVADGEAVDTVAIGAVMAVYNWPVDSDRYRKVARFVDAFFGNFEAFLKPPRHAKWREVNLAAQVPGWTRFAPAETWLKREVVAGNGSGQLRQEFETFLDASARSDRGRASSRQREALFEEFLRWQGQKQQR